MSDGPITSGTRTLRIQLTAGALAKKFPRSLREEIDRFEPLPFPAGEDAIAWLRRHIRQPGEFPLLTILDLDAESEALLAFCVLGYIPYDFDSTPGQVAGEIAWLARSARTEPGFGERLFAYALRNAEQQGLSALVVTPHDTDTAEKVWVERFHFRPPPPEDQPESEPPRLFLPLQFPENGGLA